MYNNKTITGLGTLNKTKKGPEQKSKGRPRAKLQRKAPRKNQKKGPEQKSKERPRGKIPRKAQSQNQKKGA